MDDVRDTGGKHAPDGNDPGGEPGRRDRGRRAGRGVGRPGRGRALVWAGVLLVAGVSAVGALGLGGGDADTGGADQGRSSQVVRVSRGTLTDQTEIDGQLGHGPQVPFQIRAEGTVTWLPESDATLRRGDAVLRVNDRPVVLLYGSLPMYRDLTLSGPADPADGSDGRPDDGADDGKGSEDGEGSDSGAEGSDGTGSEAAADTAGAGSQREAAVSGMDVRQFETNLSALGYSGFTVDDEYTALTADAVRRWQEDLGLPETGEVGIGDVVYAPGPVRIATTGVRVGADASGEPVSYTSTSRMVTVEAPAADTDWARRGTEVTVELPGGHTVQGEVARVGKEASAPEGPGGAEGGGEGGAAQTATVSVLITFADQQSLGRLESGPVTVRYVVGERKDVLTVPVSALVALAEGGHGLELVEGDSEGPGRFLPVRTGLFANGQVEVSGPGVREGMKVRIPK
ncbi:peptidoglycan-binding protein [Wenjunlia vitaminophila]|uniref:Peptidoglycan-binding protein n=1 Tax=Wenjunlia vitaminophila TaxID=76728 RepID=A0A0T6LN69_WENVI|nr:peptidoglycan-binding protein [Wenjunlia vitaminophila]KRV47527.1 peptidoglycan-binding protein [Wenjunlia vitaminophila]